jgi:hypothetical protein
MKLKCHERFLTLSMDEMENKAKEPELAQKQAAAAFDLGEGSESDGALTKE